jgi:hypothetical protein
MYRDARERFDQVLIGSERPTTFLVIVVDRASRAVLGHHVLFTPAFQRVVVRLQLPAL